MAPLSLLQKQLAIHKEKLGIVKVKENFTFDQHDNKKTQREFVSELKTLGPDLFDDLQSNLKKKDRVYI